MTGKKKHSPRIRKNLNNVDNVEEKPGAIRAFHVELLHKLRHHITGIDHAEKNHSNGRRIIPMMEVIIPAVAIELL